MKKCLLSLLILFSITVSSYQKVFAANYNSMISRAGVLIEINSNSETINICNGFVIGLNTVMTAHHCILKSAKHYGSNLELNSLINFSEYIFITGELDSRNWFYDWSQGPSFFFNKYPGAALVTGYKKYTKTSLNEGNDFVHLKLHRDVISENNFEGIEFNYNSNDLDSLNIVSYALTCQSPECLQRKVYKAVGRVNQSPRHLEYRMNQDPYMSTQRFSGSMIIGDDGALIGLHVGSENSSYYNKSAVLFDQSNIDQVINYLDRDFN